MATARFVTGVKSTATKEDPLLQYKRQSDKHIAQIDEQTRKLKIQKEDLMRKVITCNANGQNAQAKQYHKTYEATEKMIRDLEMEKLQVEQEAMNMEHDKIVADRQKLLISKTKARDAIANSVDVNMITKLHDHTISTEDSISSIKDAFKDISKDSDKNMNKGYDDDDEEEEMDDCKLQRFISMNNDYANMARDEILDPPVDEKAEKQRKWEEEMRAQFSAPQKKKQLQ